MTNSLDHPGTEPTLAEFLKNANVDATVTCTSKSRVQPRGDSDDDRELDPSRLTYLRPHQAAQFIGVAVSTLARWRVEGNGPRFVRPIGMRMVTYDKADLVAWLEASKRQSTSEGGK